MSRGQYFVVAFQGVPAAPATTPLIPNHQRPSTTMDVDVRGNMMDWDESVVVSYLTKLGYAQYEEKIRGVLHSATISRELVSTRWHIS